MKQGWRTRAIGRHLIELPAHASTIESYSFNRVPISPLPDIDTLASYEQLIAGKERSLRMTTHAKHGTMFVERVQHANDAVTLISWNRPTGDILYLLDTYFRAGNRTLNYAREVAPHLKTTALGTREELSHEWRQIDPVEIPAGVGFVVDDAILADTDFNPESWRMLIRLPGKPDVSFEITSYAQDRTGPGLRERAGGIVAGLAGTVAGFSRLRNRERPVGPIQADEILIAGTQNGKRGYGFKWEAPGKVNSLAEPNLNATLEVGESAYTTNRESFASDEEALELWDAVIDSIRLRPGAV